MTRRLLRLAFALALLPGWTSTTHAQVVHLYHSSSSTLQHPHREVIRDSSRWAQVWGFTGRRESLPPVDFSREMVILAALGAYASTGYEVTVDSARVADGQHLIYLHTTLNDYCPGGAAMTAPMDLVRLPRSDLPIRYAEYTVQRKC